MKIQSEEGEGQGWHHAGFAPTFPVWGESSQAGQAASVAARSQQWGNGTEGEDIGNSSTSKQAEVTTKEVVEVTIVSLSTREATIATQQRQSKAGASTDS